MNAFLAFKIWVRIRDVQRTSNHVHRKFRTECMSPNETEYSDRGQLLNAVSRLQNAVKNFLAMLRMRSGYLKDALGSEEFNTPPIVFVGSLQIILLYQMYPTVDFFKIKLQMR